jgi:hypothetical protein
MVSRGAAWTTNMGPRWFVRVAAVLVGLANLVGVILWFVGGLRVLGGESTSSLQETLPAVIATIVASLATAQIAIGTFELPGRGFWHSYGVVVRSVCIGGMIEGGLLGWVFSLDGTLFPEPLLGSSGFYAGHPLLLLADLARVLLGAGLVGAVIGLAVGLAEGLILGLPLAAALGALRDD